jgi:hypothetical protein
MTNFLKKHASGSYMGAFFRTAGPLLQYFIAMGGSTNMASAAALQNPAAVRGDLQWANNVCATREEAMRTRESFSATELHSTDLIAPRGNIIFSLRDPTSVVKDPPPTTEKDVIPDLL